MNELKDTVLQRKPESMAGAEAASLRNTVMMLNDPALNNPAFDPSIMKRTPLGPDPDEELYAKEPAPVQQHEPPPAPALPGEPLFDSNKVGYTGRLAAGKDFIADLTKATILGFADPLYHIASYFFGVEVTSTKNKDLPGMRTFLQIVSQWGRNVVNEQYPYTPARAVFISAIRSLGSLGHFDGFEVDWDSYGRNDAIWTDALVRRAKKTTGKIATTNIRFDVEFNKLITEGRWTHFHVICSPATWAKRLATKKLTPQSKELNDISEQMAIKMDRGIAHMIKTQPNGPKIRCVWNDDAPCPSPRLFTVAEFLGEFNKEAAAPMINMALE